MMKCDNCIKNGICQKKAQFLKMYPLGKIGYCYAFIKKDSEQKPITNGDRIRAMTDEELADFLWGFDCEEASKECEGVCTLRRLISWLKQPVKEET